MPDYKAMYYYTKGHLETTLDVLDATIKILQVVTQGVVSINAHYVEANDRFLQMILNRTKTLSDNTHLFAAFAQRTEELSRMVREFTDQTKAESIPLSSAEA